MPKYYLQFYCAFICLLSTFLPSFSVFGYHRDRHGFVRRRLQEGERVDEFVPAKRERENERRDQTRYRKRHDDFRQYLPARGAVYQGAFLKLIGNGLEVPHQQPGREWDEQRRINQDQR